jgi:segregation and condensation protein A
MISVLEEKGSIVFSDLFIGRTEKPFFIATFLALLELMKISLVRVVQNKQDSVIRLFYQ